MKKSLIFIFLIFGFTAFAQNKSSQKYHPVFKSDLSNAIYDEGIWSMKNGILQATEDKQIWTKTDYENFVLELDFKNEKASNSGVFIYCSKWEGGSWLANSIEIQIADDYHETYAKEWPDNWKCGAFFGLKPALKKEVVFKPGLWNHYKIIAKGSKIKAYLNDILVNDLDLKDWKIANYNADGSKMPEWLTDGVPKTEKPTIGKIGFQGKHMGAPIYLKNIKVRAL